MKNTSSSALALDSYTTRLGTEKKLEKKESIYNSMSVSYLATLLFVIIDFTCLYTLWNVVQTENPAMLLLIAIGCAVCLDVPMSIAGVVLKKHHQNLETKKATILLMTLCISAVLITFAFQFGFRIVTRDACFSSNAVTVVNTIQATSAEKDTEDAKVIYAALFCAVIPLATSIASFVITYFSCDPIRDRISVIRKAIIGNESNIIEIKQGIIECGDVLSHARFLLAKEQDLYDAHVDAINAEGVARKQAVRVAVMRKMTSPDDVSIIKKFGDDLNDDTPEPTVSDRSINYLYNVEY